MLSFYLRRKQLEFSKTLQLMQEAELLMQGSEYEVTSLHVLNLTAHSRCSAYDSEFVALARDLGVPLVTSDTMILSEFPSTTISLNDFNFSRPLD